MWVSSKIGRRRAILQNQKTRNDDVGEQQNRQKVSDPAEPKKGTV